MRGWKRRILAVDLYCAADSGNSTSLSRQTMAMIAQPQLPNSACSLASTQQALAEHREQLEAAVVDRALQARHVLRGQLRDQLRADPQARVGDRLLPRRERERRAHRVDAVDLAGGGQAEARGLVLLRDPGGEEVVLQQRDPTAGDGL